jgi:hypothetical protein
MIGTVISLYDNFSGLRDLVDCLAKMPIQNTFSP